MRDNKTILPLMYTVVMWMIRRKKESSLRDKFVPQKGSWVTGGEEELVLGFWN